ncbi:cyclase family protein [Lacibacter sp. MH-610]|uniref:cyclase family protein n=1 Tax=Lacibacter sp. MH-610 TaxID=3020883 RepID=UPI00389207A0
MRKLLVFIFCCSLFGCTEKTEHATLQQHLKSGQWIDLSYDFSDKTLYWPNNPTGFKLDTQFNGMTDAGFYYSSNAFFTPEHGGTHLDAPVHFAKGKWSADEIPLQSLLGEAVVIDVSRTVGTNADYLISVDDVTAWEKTNSTIPDDAIVLFKTGWGKFYPDAEKYLGTKAKGDSAVANLHFPSISPELATWMVKNRKIKAVGVDVASVDYGQSKDFKTHQILYEKNILGFENIANMDALPVKGAYIIALPMKIKGGTGGPLRVIAWIPKTN